VALFYRSMNGELQNHIIKTLCSEVWVWRHNA